MSYELTGRIIEIGDTQQISDRFKRRDFIVETVTEGSNGKQYEEYPKLQLTQDKCGIIDRHKIGDTVKVHFNLKGKRFEKDGKTNFFNVIEAWRIESADGVHYNQNAMQNSTYNR